MTPSERKALDDYVAAVRQHYGKRLVDILIFGSRARGDARPDSDLDLAVILEDGDWKVWDERWFLSGLAYDALIDEGSISNRGQCSGPHGRSPPASQFTTHRGDAQGR